MVKFKANKIKTVFVIVLILFVSITVYENLKSTNCSFGRYHKTKANISTISTALDLYKLDHGEFPASLETLISAPDKYLKGNWSLNDPFGYPYRYRHPGLHGDYDIWSNGKDGKPGGDCMNSDIESWRLEANIIPSDPTFLQQLHCDLQNNGIGKKEALAMIFFPLAVFYGVLRFNARRANNAKA